MQIGEIIFLSDKQVVGEGKTKERPWRKNKKLSTALAESYKRVAESLKDDNELRLQYLKKAYDCECCASWLSFKEYENDTKKLYHMWPCRLRLCPMCAWRRSLKVFCQVSRVMNYLTKTTQYNYVFLTLTVRNVVDDDLSKAIDMLMAGWKRLIETKEFKKVSKGYFRALEVTHNVERKDFHPHFHVIIAVSKSYFNGGSGGYVSQSTWRRLWRHCCGLSYDPWVYIEKVKLDKTYGEKKGKRGKSVSGEREISYAGAISEIAKYTVKAADVILDPYQMSKELGLTTQGETYRQFAMQCQEYMDKSVFTLDNALKNRRLVSFGGAMREAHKVLNLDDSDDGTDIDPETGEIRADLGYVIKTYLWSVDYMNYVLFAIRCGENE